MPRTLATLGLVLGLLVTLLAPRPRAEDAPSPAPRTVILLRHAEKESNPTDPRDPALSEAGIARSNEIARFLGEVGATHVFASEYRRTQSTVAPLAARAGVEVRAIPAGKPAETLAALDALPAGSVAVVCGHSNTVPALAGVLGVELRGLVAERGQRMLPDDAYDRAFVVTRPATGPASCIELRYGAASGATANSGK